MSFAVSAHQLSKGFIFDQKKLKKGLIQLIKPIQKKLVLQNINIEVKKGEVLGLYGPNGSGKSTLLRILAGVLPADTGEVEINGSVAAVFELGAGFNPEMSGLENIELYGTLIGLSRRKLQKITPQIIEFSELAEKIHLPLKKFSSGMQARLAFSIVAFSDADILIFDEVFAVGDQDFTDKSTTLLQKLAKNKTIVLASHSLNLLESFCDRVIVLDEAGIQQQKVAAEFLRHLRINTVFAAEIVSNSMAPSYVRGDKVKVIRTPFEKLEIGDPVVIYLEKVGTMITHRLNMKVQGEKGESYFTKGDNVPQVDSWQITPENYVGKILGKWE